MNAIKDNELLNSIIEEICGKEGVFIASFLDTETEITDDVMVELIDWKVNDVRRILYKLYENNLASYRRVRNKETGWFVYYWKLNPKKVLNLIKRFCNYQPIN